MMIPSVFGFMLGEGWAVTHVGPWLWALPGVVVISLLMLRRRMPQVVWIGLLCLVLGTVYTECYIQWHKTPIFIMEQDNQIVRWKGQVVGIPHREAHRTRFIWQVGQARLRVEWPGKAPAWLRSGDEIEAVVRVRQPKALVNPGRDERTFFLSQGLHAEARVMGEVSLIDHHWTIDRVRERLARQVHEVAPQLRYLPILEGLVIGDKHDMPYEWNRIFQRTGTSHLMAISGLHIGLVSAFCMVLVNGLLRLKPQWCHKRPRIVISALFGLLGAILYAALAGFALPTQRALIMIAVGLGYLLLRYRRGLWHALLYAMAAIVLWDPLAILSPGFWLSCGAVAWLLYATYHKPTNTSVQQWMGIQAVLFFGLTPLCAWFFQATSLIDPLSNAFAIPWTSFVIIPLALIGFLLAPLVPPLAEAVLMLADQAAHMLVQGLSLLSSIPWSQWSLNPSLTTCVLALIGTLWMLSPTGIPGRWCGALLWLPMLFPNPIHLQPQELRVVVLDVGQGLSVYLQTAHHHLLYDVGRPQSVLPSFLEREGIKRLDALVISHFDADHAGALPLVSQQVQIKQWYSSDPTHAQWPTDFCEQGLTWTWDEVDFTFLYPEKPDPNQKKNHLSCVLKVTAGKHQLLLTGDIDAAAERILLQHADDLKATVLLVPHHGSASSSTPDFIKAVSPDLAIATTGRYNPYKHPRSAVIERYEALGIPFVDTGETGAVALFFKADTPPVHQLFKNGKLPNLWYNWGSQHRYFLNEN